MIDEWWSYKDIKFQKAQVKWLLQNLPKLKEGEWPPSPYGTGYVDPGVQTQPSRHAPFENPGDIWAEMKMRLDRLQEDPKGKRDGNLLIAYYIDEVEDYRLANISHLSIEYMERLINRALRYISGWNFWQNETKESYQRFISRKKEA